MINEFEHCGECQLKDKIPTGFDLVATRVANVTEQIGAQFAFADRRVTSECVEDLTKEEYKRWKSGLPLCDLDRGECGELIVTGTKDTSVVRRTFENGDTMTWSPIPPDLEKS